MKLNKEKDSPQTSSAPSPAPSSEPDVPDDVKSRSRSISEQSAQVFHRLLCVFVKVSGPYVQTFCIEKDSYMDSI